MMRINVPIIHILVTDSDGYVIASTMVETRCDRLTILDGDFQKNMLDTLEGKRIDYVELSLKE